MNTPNMIQKYIVAGCLTLIFGTAAADPIYSSSSFTNPASGNQGAPVAGANGWYFNNVRNGGSVAVDATHPRSGDGSVSMSGPANAKADIEYLPNAFNVGGNYAPTASLGALSGLSSMSYDWFRDSSSTASAIQHPSLRVLIDADGNLETTSDRGGLVFESVYNVPNTTVDAWITESVSDSSYLWNFGTPLGFGGNINATPYAYDATLAEWKTYFQNAAIIGFSSGIGSGWQSYSGAVDNIGWTINGVSKSTNFEVSKSSTVPEPGSIALFALGAFVIGVARRRGRSC